MDVKVLSGNKAAAHGVRLARPDVIAMYPITPQTPLAEELAKFHAEGLIDAEIIEVEGEHTAMSAITGAAVAGGRVFTATSSWGLSYMNEPFMFCAGNRVPAVMVNVTRETSSLRGVGGSRQDIMTARDGGWIQIEPETCQEVLDSVLIAYRLSEDPRVLLPVVVAYDGFFLSHQYERVEVPDQATVDKFLAPVSARIRSKLDDPRTLHFSISLAGMDFANYRKMALEAMEGAKAIHGEVEDEFAALFGRRYGMIDTYRADDAEIIYLTAGSCSGTIRTIVDRARNRGHKIGLARLRVFRPYPREEMARVLEGKKAVAVIERSICLGWNCGHLFQEARAVLPDVTNPPKMVDFIDGLSSLDITADHLEKALAITMAAADGQTVKETNWLIWE
ncbi:MAG: pyruvate synthase subunit PorA [Deltaproteobacteria bacterium]|jgi:pyruvate/2-oxoacid:ferredoxin oxidoreductase alpha subunit|nr:pyruvate synthase subunit PorA [Deltaproteobacteria bacterium]